ncbi:CNNM domain-containing protein [Methylobacterium oryzae CBMB20]
MIALNGVFSLSELAVVSARRSRLRALAEKQPAPARRRLWPSPREPGRFLLTVQIGITLIGILSRVVSGAALGDRLAGADDLGLPRGWADTLGYGLVIPGDHLSVGDHRRACPEGISRCAIRADRPARWRGMRVVSAVALPAVWLLDASTRAVFRLIGQETESASAVTEEEIRSLVAEAETRGSRGRRARMIAACCASATGSCAAS